MSCWLPPFPVFETFVDACVDVIDVDADDDDDAEDFLTPRSSAAVAKKVNVAEEDDDDNSVADSPYSTSKDNSYIPPPVVDFAALLDGK